MRCFIPQKRSEINVDILVFIPHIISIRSTTVEDFFRQVTSNSVNVLTHRPKSTETILQLGDVIINSLLQVTNLLSSTQVTSTVIIQNQYQLTAAVAHLSPPRAPPASDPSPNPRLSPILVPSSKPASFHLHHYRIITFEKNCKNLQGYSSTYDLQGR